MFKNLLSRLTSIFAAKGEAAGNTPIIDDKKHPLDGPIRAAEEKAYAPYQNIPKELPPIEPIQSTELPPKSGTIILSPVPATESTSVAENKDNTITVEKEATKNTVTVKKQRQSRKPAKSNTNAQIKPVAQKSRKKGQK